MKSHVAGSTAQFVARRHQGRAIYSKVFDQRKRRIRGLWERNGTFYAQLTVTDENTGKKIVRRMRMEDADGKPDGRRRFTSSHSGARLCNLRKL